MTASLSAAADGENDPLDLDVLREIELRVLWLSTAMIHHANHVRPNASGLKVGGHQASCASMVSIMTALWFTLLEPEDRISVKPHASPVLHAINYLLGDLDESYLTTLRQFGGLQAYPSRTKDPDTVDYSTGSVGIGATASIWGALSRRYVNATLNAHTGTGRQYSLVGDAELDEGATWEAVVDSTTREIGEIVWIVDLNRQSLDRVVPNIAASRLELMFSAAGWQVLTVKFGKLLDSLFIRPGGKALRDRILDMSNHEYQRLLRCGPTELRSRLPGRWSDSSEIASLIADLDDQTLLDALRNLGGHDMHALIEAFTDIDDSRPTVILAYTIKGYGLPSEGHPQNHSALLSVEQYDTLATKVGMDPISPWRRFETGTRAGQLCHQTAKRLRRRRTADIVKRSVPTDFGRTPKGTTTTQAALGRTLLDLTREAPDIAQRIVTVSPDVSSTTNLGGWINKVGVWSTGERHDWFADDSETLMHWRENPTGQHLELGIAETNLVGLIGELGATWSRWGQPLYPIGVLYDPFVERALEPWKYGIYAGGQSILIGTPSGVTLAAEGGAHQSITTPSVGIETPGLITYEPAFAIDAEWALLASIARLGHVDGTSAYLRLSTRPVDQQLAKVPLSPAGRERRRKQVVAGGYALVRKESAAVVIVAMGAVLTEALSAARQLESTGIIADVICVTSPGLLFQAMQARHGRSKGDTSILDQLFPASRATPMVTVLDGHPHTLSFLAGINRVHHIACGVSNFGQTGSLEDVYRHHGLDADSIATAALDVTDAAGQGYSGSDSG